MRSPRLRGRAVIDEGRANVVAAPARSLVLVVAAGLVAFLVVTFTLTDVAGISQRYRDQVRAGRFVLVARSAEPSGLDVDRCDALNALEGVRSAGSVLTSRSVYPAAAPARPYEVLTVTPGLIPAWFPGSTVRTDAPGWFVGPDAADELGLTDRSSVAVAAEADDGGPRPVHTVEAVDRVLPSSPRRDDADRDLFEVVPAAGKAPSCVVDADPSAHAAVDETVNSWFPPDQQVNVTAYLDDQGPTRLPEQELADRPSAAGWAVGATVVGLLAAFLWYGRREEFALYRLLGVTRTALAGLLAVEAVLTTVVPAVAGAAVAVVVLRGRLDVFARPELAGATVGLLAGLDLAAFLLALVPVPLLGLVVVARRSPFDLLKGF